MDEHSGWMATRGGGLRILALDFDGVISDSAPECFRVALETYVQMVPATALRRSFEEIDGGNGGGRGERAHIVRQALYQSFVSLMPLGNRAEDFGVALAALDTGNSLPDQDAYDTFRDERGTDFLTDYHRKFYGNREALRARDEPRWQQLMGPYEPFVELLRRRGQERELALATAKDRASVDRLLGRYGLADLFDEDCILDKEVGVTKRLHLEALSRRRSSQYREITFVDDKVNHLDSVASLGVRCVLATWGYNGPRERKLARDRGYLLCGLDDAERQLFGPSPTQQQQASEQAR